MKAAAIYARVSTAEQVKGTSLDGQVALCHDYAKEHGYTVIKAVQEDASGARLDRPRLGELRDMAQRREIEALIVFDPDRLSRSMVHTMMLLEEFERNKAGVLFVNAPREDTPEGEMLFGMRALFAQYERTKIFERTKRGKERRIQGGQVMSSRCCAFGYEYHSKAKCLRVLDREAVWVVKMFQWMVDEGLSLRQIAGRLQAQGVPTKTGAQVWHPATVRAILSNETYAGTWHYGTYAITEPTAPMKAERKRAKSSKERRPRPEWLSVAVPAIVPQATFDAVSARLEHNKAMSPRNCKRQYLLRGLLVCARCGHKLNGAGGYRYECPGDTPKHVYLKMEKRCGQCRISLSRLEGAVWGEVVRQLSDEGVLKAKLAEIEAGRKSNRKDAETELEVLTSLEAGLKQDADKLLDFAMSGIIDKATLQERMAVIREKQAGVARSKADVLARMAQWDQGPASEEALKRLCELARRGLPHLDFEERRAFLEGMDVLIKMDGCEATITGLITDRTLTIARGRAAPPEEAGTDDILSKSPPGVIFVTPTGDTLLNTRQTQYLWEQSGIQLSKRVWYHTGNEPQLELFLKFQRT